MLVCYYREQSYFFDNHIDVFVRADQADDTLDYGYGVLADSVFIVPDTVAMDYGEYPLVDAVAIYYGYD
ncbi:MAG: hypothetical protein P4L79_10060 [Legionella sp.]|uniref:hypothetical protein n=1 Tax=Legionella sp. TaxID=459 RepID=UPI002846024C|nr:hypothetical protein [Legionella sp.]